MDHLTGVLDVVRTASLVPEFRAAAAGTDTLGTMTGHFTTWDTWYEVSSWLEGDFLERTLAGSTAQTIAEDRDGMRVLFNHGFDVPPGDMVLGPIEDLREDDEGAYYEVPLFDTSYGRDLLPGLKAGVYGASMRMRVTADEWDDEPDPSDHNPKALPERSISRMRVMEFGPVTFPANPSASAGMRSGVRSLTDAYYEQLATRDARAYDDALRAAGRTPPDFTGRPGARSAGGGDGKTAGVDSAEEALRHARRVRQDRALRLKRII